MAALTTSSHLDEACQNACSLLLQLGQMDPQQRHRPITASFLKGCKGLVFTKSVKAGLVVGVSRGHGIVVRHLGGGKWSAPLHVTMTLGKAGALAGYEKVSTVMAATSTRLFDQLELGLIPTFGVDISVQSQDNYELGPGGGPGDRGAWGPDDRGAFGASKSDLLSISTSNGMFMSLGNLQGGATTVDSARNEECYGKGVSSSDILSGNVPHPPQLKPLYEALDAILAAGDLPKDS